MVAVNEGDSAVDQRRLRIATEGYYRQVNKAEGEFFKVNSGDHIAALWRLSSSHSLLEARQNTGQVSDEEMLFQKYVRKLFTSDSMDGKEKSTCERLLQSVDIRNKFAQLVGLQQKSSSVKHVLEKKSFETFASLVETCLTLCFDNNEVDR